MELAADHSVASASASADDRGWQKVTYPKRQRRQNHPSAATTADRLPNGLPSNVFASVERAALDRRKAMEVAAASSAADRSPAPAVAAGSDDDDDGSGAEAPKENGVADAEKKTKPKREKKPKVTVADAASQINHADLAAFLVDVSASYESHPGIQLMRFADYFGRAFASVSASQFPTKMFKESPVSKIDIPLSQIPESVCKTSTNWIAMKPAEALGDFTLWCLDSILADLATQQASSKGSKKSVQQHPLKAQVAIFAALAMTLRRKPEVLLNLLPKLKENPKYQGQEKLPIIIWSIGQASQGDLVIGMYSWAHYLLPTACEKSGGNPQSRDWLLQLVERFLSGTKARSILLNGAVRKGERLVSPSSFDLLLRATFPSPSARVKATDRFVAIYPTLKELALAGSSGTKTAKQASQQLLPYMIKAMQGDNEELRKEATDIFIWCLTQNAECYKQWEKHHLENIKATVAVLQKLSDQWKEYSTELSAVEPLKETLQRLRAMNEEALSESLDASRQLSIKDANKYCGIILRKLTRRRLGCSKSSIFLLILAVWVAAFWKEAQEMLKVLVSS